MLMLILNTFTKRVYVCERERERERKEREKEDRRICLLYFGVLYDSSILIFRRKMTGALNLRHIKKCTCISLPEQMQHSIQYPLFCTSGELAQTHLMYAQK
jgi:hypothetical protein